MSRCCTIEAPGKINLHLEIGEKRADGYHDLVSVFASLGFGDTLVFSVLGEGFPRNFTALEITGPYSEAEGLCSGENIVTRAAALFREKTGYDEPVRAVLKKRVPPGGGFGGGSSDAASALLALDALAETRLGGGDLAEMGEKLGSDVPFFLSGGLALVTGRGDRVKSFEIPGIRLPVVLVNPGFSSGTAAAFAKLDGFRAEKAEARRFRNSGRRVSGLKDTGDSFRAKRPGGEDLVWFLKENPASWPYDNDFLPVLQEDGERGEVYRRIFRELRELGADFSGLSGSGSGCFGIFTDKGAAENACDSLFRNWNFVKLTFFLARRPKPVLEYQYA
ncbi:MAG: 4-(cytidine 5'-diphospho)-2-C-methyl-D-erythritol kinase [Spirochaetaceae bacterium]|nr:4-(cytidine 5'-diphospho)-2-C-methyl-D-erythritol kinase [Spirochaetaceae bacterium]